MEDLATGVVASRNEDSRSLPAVLDMELDRAYRVAFRILDDARDAEDAVQEALTRAWAARAGLRNPDAAAGWFWRILVNTCRSKLRHRRRLPNVAELTENQLVPSIDPFEAALARDAVFRAMPCLSEDQRITVILRFWGEFTVPEISRRMNVREGTVKSRLHAALGALKREIDQHGGTPQ